MSSVSDEILAGGIPHLDALHGESVTVLTGQDEGQTFRAIREIEQDVTVDAILSEDRRMRRMIRFIGTPPRLGSRDVVRTADGQRWICTRQPGVSYLTTDFELVELHATKDS